MKYASILSLILFYSFNCLAGFQELKEYAFKKSPDILSKEKERDEKKSAEWVGYTRWFPRLDWQLSQSTTNSNFYTGAPGADLTTYFQSTLTASMPIYKRSVQLGLSISQQEFDLIDIELQNLKSDLERKLSISLGNWLLAQLKVSSLKQNFSSSEKSEKEIKIRFQNGSRSELDYLRIQAQTTQLDSQIRSAQNDVENLFQQLIIEFGLSKSDLSDLFFAKKYEMADLAKTWSWLDEVSNVGEFNLSEAQIISQLSESRSIILANKNFELNELKLKQIWSSELPEVNAQAIFRKVGLQSNDLNDTPEAKTMMVTLTIPIFSFGGGYASYKESLAAQQKNLIQYEKQKRQIQEQILQSFYQLDAQKKLVEALQIRLAQATRLDQLTQRSFELGKSSILDLLQAQNELVSARMDLAKGKLDKSQLIRKLNWELVK